MVIERVYNIPLRKGFHQTARYKKAKKAGAVLKEFLSRHMKQPDMDKVLIGTHLNAELWKHGIKNPPAQVKVTVIKEDNGDVKAELYGFPYAHKKKAEKESEKPEKKQKAEKDSVEEKAKDDKKKSTTAEKHEHSHEGHEHNHEHHDHHEEKHEHAAAQTHEHPKPAVKKAPAKKPTKKAE